MSNSDRLDEAVALARLLSFPYDSVLYFIKSHNDLRSILDELGAVVVATALECIASAILNDSLVVYSSAQFASLKRKEGVLTLAHIQAAVRTNPVILAAIRADDETTEALASFVDFATKRLISSEDVPAISPAESEKLCVETFSADPFSTNPVTADEELLAQEHDLRREKWQRRREDLIQEAEIINVLKSLHPLMRCANDSAVLLQALCRAFTDSCFRHIISQSNAEKCSWIDIDAQTALQRLHPWMDLRALPGVEEHIHRTLACARGAYALPPTFKLKVSFVRGAVKSAEKSVTARADTPIDEVLHNARRKLHVETKDVLLLHRGVVLSMGSVVGEGIAVTPSLVFIVERSAWEHHRREEARKGLATTTKSANHVLKALKSNAQSKIPPHVVGGVSDVPPTRRQSSEGVAAALHKDSGHTRSAQSLSAMPAHGKESARSGYHDDFNPRIGTSPGRLSPRIAFGSDAQPAATSPAIDDEEIQEDDTAAVTETVERESVGTSAVDDDAETAPYDSDEFDDASSVEENTPAPQPGHTNGSPVTCAREGLSVLTGVDESTHPQHTSEEQEHRAEPTTNSKAKPDGSSQLGNLKRRRRSLAVDAQASPYVNPPRAWDTTLASPTSPQSTSTSEVRLGRKSDPSPHPSSLRMDQSLLTPSHATTALTQIATERMHRPMKTREKSSLSTRTSVNPRRPLYRYPNSNLPLHKHYSTRAGKDMSGQVEGTVCTSPEYSPLEQYRSTVANEEKPGTPWLRASRGKAGARRMRLIPSPLPGDQPDLTLVHRLPQSEAAKATASARRRHLSTPQRTLPLLRNPNHAREVKQQGHVQDSPAVVHSRGKGSLTLLHQKLSPKSSDPSLTPRTSHTHTTRHTRQKRVKSHAHNGERGVQELLPACEDSVHTLSQVLGTIRRNMRRLREAEAKQRLGKEVDVYALLRSMHNTFGQLKSIAASGEEAVQQYTRTARLPQLTHEPVND